MATEDLRVRVLLDDADFRAGIRNMVQDMRNTQRQGSNLGNVFGGITNAIKGIAGAWIGLNIAEGLKDAVTEGLKYNMMLEDANTKWETLMGSQEKSKETVKELQDLALKTNFDFKGVDQVATSLQMAGIGGDNLGKNIMRISDALSAIGKGGDSEAITGIARAIQQMGAKGKVSAEEINQMAERGINGWKLMAMAQLGYKDATKMNSDEVNKLAGSMMKQASEGKFLAKEGIPLLLKGMDLYNGATEKTQKNMSATIARIKEMASMMAGTATVGLFNALKPELAKVYEKMQLVNDLFKAFNGTLTEKDAGGAKKFKEIVDLANKLQKAFKDIGQAWKPIWDALKQGFNEIAKAFKSSGIDGFKDTMVILGKVIGFFVIPIIKAIVNVVLGLKKVWDGIVLVWKGFANKDAKMIWDGIKKIFLGALQAIWGAIVLYFSATGSGGILGKLSKFGGAVVKWVVGLGKKWLGKFSQIFANILAGTGRWAGSFLQKCAKVLDDIIKAIKNWKVWANVKKIWDSVIRFLKSINLYDIGASIGKKLIDGFKAMFSGIGSWISSKLHGGSGGSTGGSYKKHSSGYSSSPYNKMIQINNYSPKALSAHESSRYANQTLARYANRW